MKATLLLVIHFHQPVGNFDNVIRRIYDKCYKPLLETISKYEKIKLNMHLSGSLLDWFSLNTPEILDEIRKLVKRNQIEVIGGANYEPILSTIPERDRIGQIDLMKRNIKSLFGTSARGAWIPERVWEPHLVSDLARSGIEYIVLDDTHLIYAGIKKEDTYGYYISEDNGNTVAVFPSDKVLRYSIPFREVRESIAYMKKITERKDNVIFTYGDDAEKFGEWPGTHKLVYEYKWLENFFKTLVKNENWLSTKTLSECIEDSPPLGRTYLPTSSYEEMLEWALPVEKEIAFRKIQNELKKENRKDKYLPFIRGGFFRNFFTKYDEANQIHKRMIYVSNLIDRVKKAKQDRKRVEEAEKELYKGQCNCAYWHGVFGGLYLHHLRQALYEHLLKSENMCNDITKTKNVEKHEVMDFDGDSFKEVILQNKDIWLCVKPSLGGGVIEFDVRKKTVNLLNILSRYKERYHDRIPGPFAYDRHRKCMFGDYFLPKNTTIDDFKQVRYKEEGDFLSSPYDFKLENEKENNLFMEKLGKVDGALIKLTKELILKDSTLTACYKITNLSKTKKEFKFGVELPFIMPNANSAQYNFFVNNERGSDFAVNSKAENNNVRNVSLKDTEENLGISLNFRRKCNLWRFPIMTISQFENGYEENYQGSVIFPYWEFSLDGGETLDLEFDFTVDLYEKAKV